jgi:hypothetical protein
MLRRLIFACLIGLTALAAPVRAADSVDALARDVSRAESFRAVLNLQRSYAQYAQFGLWSEVSRLFTPNGRFVFDGQITPGEKANGQSEIASLLMARYGGGHEGVRAGELSTMMIETPVVNLSVDGNSAKGRWHILTYFGHGGTATIEGGIFENDYVREGGVWKIAQAHYYPQYTGPYETGWTNWGGGDLPIVPYHFDSDTAGVPIPPAVGAAPKSDMTLAALARRVTRLNDEDRIRNLQAAYGFYQDRKMWDDVTDLFAKDGVVQIAGQGIWRGRSSIHRWFETMGPAGLKHGQLQDQVQFDITVEIAPGGNEAWARGIELGMLGEADQEKGWWSITVFRNRFVKEGGVWKILEMRRFPVMKTDYDIGWAKSWIVDPAPTGAGRPDAPSPATTAPPPFARHPVTGKTVAAATMTPLTPVIAAGKPSTVTLDEARRRLNRSLAYDGVVNVSSAYGDYLDDYNSPAFSALLAEKGFKMSAFAGYYIGRDRVTEAGVRVWGKVPVTRPGVSYHWRVQPVLLISDDGVSVNGHIRLFQPRTGKTIGGAGLTTANFGGGIYHDQFVLERGVWRFWNLSLDEPYINPIGWKGGWAKSKDPPPPPPGGAARPPSVLVAANSDFKPDVPVTALGKRQEHFRGGTGETWQWPTILPMWFEYTNPVTGRVPELFQDDCVPCSARKDLRLDANGFLQPPDAPAANKSEER